MPNSKSLININDRISELEKEKLKLQAKKDPLSAKKIKAKLEKINKELENLNKEKKEIKKLEKDSKKIENENISYKNKENDNLKKFYKILNEEQWEQTKKELNEKKSRVWYYILWYLSLWCALICCRKAFLCILFFVIGSILIAMWGDEEEGK